MHCWLLEKRARRKKGRRSSNCNQPPSSKWKGWRTPPLARSTPGALNRSEAAQDSESSEENWILGLKSSTHRLVEDNPAQVSAQVTFTISRQSPITPAGWIGSLTECSQHLGLALSRGIRTKLLTVQENSDFEHWPLLFKQKEPCSTKKQHWTSKIYWPFFFLTFFFDSIISRPCRARGCKNIARIAKRCQENISLVVKCVKLFLP